MSTEFAISEITTGRLNALVKNIMSQTGVTDPNEAVRLVNSGEWVVSKLTRNWREENGVIYFSVTSDGTTGEDWIKRLESKGSNVSGYAKQIFRSPDFKPTNGVTIEVAVLKGTLFEDNDRVTKKICAVADEHKFSKPNVEVAALIREKFTDEEIEQMGLWYIVAMHEPINDSAGVPHLLSARRNDDGHWLSTYYVKPDDRWVRGYGFAFAVSQVINSQN